MVLNKKWNLTIASGQKETEEKKMSDCIKGSQTEKNLLIAFAGESQARNRYSYFSGAAKKEGLVQISAIFEETANQEKEHAKRFFKLLEGVTYKLPKRSQLEKLEQH
jgi:rubrerythrin